MRKSAQNLGNKIFRNSQLHMQIADSNKTNRPAKSADNNSFSFYFVCSKSKNFNRTANTCVYALFYFISFSLRFFSKLFLINRYCFFPPNFIYLIQIECFSKQLHINFIDKYVMFIKKNTRFFFSAEKDKNIHPFSTPFANVMLSMFAHDRHLTYK